MQPEISVVICTRNRAAQLPHCLESVAGLTSGSGWGWELVLVDNGSTDGTDRVIQQFKQDHDLPVVTVREGPPGLARARNRGLSVAKGRIIAFTDDDCYPQSDYLRKVVDCFLESDIKYLGGRVLLFDENDARISIQEKPDRQEIPPRSFVRPGFIHGANIAFDREALIAVGGFDERLGAGTKYASGEDVEILARMSWAGMTGAYDPRPVVLHHHGRRVGSDIDGLVRGYDKGRGAYYVKFLANKESRLTYLKNWYWSIQPGNLRRLAREIIGAVSFAAMSWRQRSGIWGCAPVQLRDRAPGAPNEP